MMLFAAYISGKTSGCEAFRPCIRTSKAIKNTLPLLDFDKFADTLEAHGSFSKKKLLKKIRG
jgi:hypothetical protein